MRATRRLTRLAGALLLLVPFVPLDRVFRLENRTLQFYVPPGEWLLGLFVFGATAWLLARFVPSLADRTGLCLRALDRGLPGRRYPLLVLGILGLLLVATSAVVFRHRPLLIDSVVQLFQARIFATGHLTAPAPPGEAFVATQHMLVQDGRWFAQYPPGHAGLLSIGVLLGAVWLIPVALSLGSAWFIYRFTAAAWDERTGRLALALVALAPFFWFMGASFMNHVSCLFFVAAFLYSFQRWEAGGADRWALAAGAAIGAAGLSRPLTALAVAAVFAPIGLGRAWRSKRFAAAGLAAAGGMAAVGLYLAYNAATTGEPLTPGYLALWGASHGVGFHATPWGAVHSPWTGLRNESIDLSLLSSFLFEWPVPALLPVGVYGVLTGGRDAWSRRLFAAFLAIPAAYFFYWHRDAYLGPRFLFSGLAFLLPLTARALLALGEIRSRHLLLYRVAFLLVVMSFAYATLYSAPRRFAGYASSLQSMKTDLPAAAAAEGIDDGVVFVAVSWGNRLLSRMREVGAGASVAEAVYRRADHCDIERLLGRARADNWSAVKIRTALEGLPRAGVQKNPLNGDPTLRLRPGPLAPECRAELAHDEPGYGNWLPHLLDNDPGLSGSLIVVRDLRAQNAEFLQRRPGRPAWLWRPSGFRPLDLPEGD